MARKPRDRTKPPLPSRDEVLTYIKENPGRIGKREIARAFGIKGADRGYLNTILKELKASGDVARSGRRVRAPDDLPSVTVIEITGTDSDGETLAQPVPWASDEKPPTIYVSPSRRGRGRMERGDRFLARLKHRGKAVYEAEVMRRVGRRQSTVLGIFRTTKSGPRIEPTDRRYKSEYVVVDADKSDAEPGDLVVAEVLTGLKLGLPQARITDRIGNADSPKAYSLIAIHAHDIPVDFPQDALVQAQMAKPVGLGKRTDLRDTPLVTIDGADARDFDDAVHAAPDDDPKNQGGWKLIVAIADVAHYVRSGDALDKAARERGNSVYFPDRVVPMLPEELSNDLCSLRPAADRACVAAHLVIDRDGKLIKYRFARALMRSAARLTYEQAQAAIDGRPDETTDPLLKTVLKPLYGAFESLMIERRARGALDLDLPERKVHLSEDGHVERIEPSVRLDSHRVIEEFMITANVAAARALEERGWPCMYRVHDAPDLAKVEALREWLRDLGIKFARNENLHAKLFNRLLAQVRDEPYAHTVGELVLRAQSQAVYSPDNRGHFGLALREYAHFTSPIRRYSDLVVHRALIGALKLGDGGLAKGEALGFDALGEHISNTERRAIAAERDTMDRYMTAYLAERVGEILEGRVSGVTRFGLFVRLDDSGGEGLIPIRRLPRDYYVHDSDQHTLTGQHDGLVYRLGDKVDVRVVEATPTTGSVVFDIQEGGGRARPRKVRPSRRRRKR